MKKPKSKAKKKGHLSEEDEALWRAVLETVEPLKGRTLPVIEDNSAYRPVAKRAGGQPRSFEAPPPPLRALPELTHDHQPGLDKATAKRLRRGQVNLEGRLDLHGMTQDQARAALENFIESAWRQGKREVLIITGKGTRADGSIGVLRRMVPRWLNLPPTRARITAFTYAAPKDGGEGALYVRIKRRQIPEA